MLAKLAFRLASGFNFQRRSIGFLEAENGEDELNAGETFDALTGNDRRKVSARMDYWLSGGTHDKYFHGWPNEPKYKECFVFKWERRKVAQRLYGFLCNPIPRSDAGFRTCVLILYVEKHEVETDFSNLDCVNSWRQDFRTTAAIAEVYPEYGGACAWLN